MKGLEVITPAHAEAWRAVLDRTGGYDVYHLPEYHALAEAMGEGTAYLFAYQEGDFTIALPLLLRAVDRVSGLESAGAGWFDATSVYGYAGPACSHNAIPASVVERFQAALRTALRDRRVVGVFSRLHPLLEQAAPLAGLGEHAVLWQTVSIDLTLPPEAQFARYRKNHREGIGKLVRKGLTVVHDTTWRYADVFQKIYHETMRRVGASPAYFFPPEYFARLRELLAGHVHLFAVLLEDRPICAALMFENQGIVQYHLSGTCDTARKLSPVKLLLDGVRQWGNGRGKRFFHLGGGMTPKPDDPLLHFKMGFSDRAHDFAVWRWIIMPDAYRDLCAVKHNWNAAQGLCSTTNDYFPLYRGSAAPRVGASGAADPVALMPARELTEAHS